MEYLVLMFGNEEPIVLNQTTFFVPQYMLFHRLNTSFSLYGQYNKKIGWKNIYSFLSKIVFFIRSQTTRLIGLELHWLQCQWQSDARHDAANQSNKKYSVFPIFLLWFWAPVSLFINIIMIVFLFEDKPGKISLLRLLLMALRWACTAVNVKIQEIFELNPLYDRSDLRIMPFCIQLASELTWVPCWDRSEGSEKRGSHSSQHYCDKDNHLGKLALVHLAECFQEIFREPPSTGMHRCLLFCGHAWGPTRVRGSWWFYNTYWERLVCWRWTV